VIIIAFLIQLFSVGLPVGNYKAINFSFDMLRTIPIYFFSFGSHITLLPMYKELSNRSYRKMGWIINISLVMIIIGYAIVGILGYMMFAGNPNFGDNILLVFENNYVPTIIAKILLIAVVIFSYPLAHYALRDSIMNIFFPNQEFSIMKWTLITLFIQVITYLIGTFITNITIVFGLIMTSSGVLVSFVIPALIYIKIETNRIKRSIAILYAIFSSILGIICFILEVITSVQRIINLFKN